MSGSGRGSPRIAPWYSAIPEIKNLNTTSPRTNAIINLQDGRWCFTLDVNAAAPQTLTGSFVDYTDGIGPSFEFPRGGIRGMLQIEYDPNDGTSQLEFEQFFPALGTLSSRGVFALGNTPVFPNSSDTLGATVPIALPVYQTQADGVGDPYVFQLPFSIPAGCPTTMSLRIRELNSVGGTFDLQRIQIENFGVP